MGMSFVGEFDCLFHFTAVIFEAYTIQHTAYKFGNEDGEKRNHSKLTDTE